MSKPSDKESKALAVQPRQAIYNVGYGKPRSHGRFKPGQSGNPKGRPKGAKNKSPTLHEERLKSSVLEEAYRTIKVNDGDKPVSLHPFASLSRTIQSTRRRRWGLSAGLLVRPGLSRLMPVQVARSTDS